MKTLYRLLLIQFGCIVAVVFTLSTTCSAFVIPLGDSLYVIPTPDKDKDGYTSAQGDCNDNVSSINPGAAEICGDDIDQDCDGSDTECAQTATGTWTGTWNSTYYYDSGGVTLRLSQSGSVISGTADFTNTDCGNLYNLTVTGTITNNVVSFRVSTTCDGDTASLEYTQGTISGNTMSGHYTTYVNGAFYDQGTFSVDR